MSFWHYSIFSAFLVFQFWFGAPARTKDTVFALLVYRMSYNNAELVGFKQKYWSECPVHFRIEVLTLFDVICTIQKASSSPCWSSCVNMMFSVKACTSLTSVFLFSLFHPFLPFSSLSLCHPPSLPPFSAVPRPYRPCSSWWLPSRCLSTFGATRRFPTSTGMKRRLQPYWKPGREDTLR